MARHKLYAVTTYKLSRAREKAIHTLYSHSASLLFRNGCPLVEEELLLYALVCTSFPEKATILRLNSREI